jgi:hypothetical protein
VHRSVVVVCSIIHVLRRFLLRKEPDLKERGNILKLCTLVKVR